MSEAGKGERCYKCGVYLNGYNGAGMFCDECRVQVESRMTEEEWQRHVEVAARWKP